MNQMPRKSVISKIADNHGVSKVEAERIMRTVLDGVAEELADRGRFHVAEIGSITIARRRPRRYFNPRTLQESVSGGDFALKLNISRRMRARLDGRPAARSYPLQAGRWIRAATRGRFAAR